MTGRASVRLWRGVSLRALSAGHDAGIVHRDIKPENIIARPDGQVKILDLGIAKYTQPTRSRESKEEWIKTATGVVIGTTACMSPDLGKSAHQSSARDAKIGTSILYLRSL